MCVPRAAASRTRRRSPPPPLSRCRWPPSCRLVRVRRQSDGWTALFRAALYGHLEVVKVLVEAGANTAARDKKGKTALDKARQENKHAVVAFLEGCAVLRAPLDTPHRGPAPPTLPWGPTPLIPRLSERVCHPVPLRDLTAPPRFSSLPPSLSCAASPHAGA